MFEDERRSATVEAIEPTSVVAVLGPDMRRLMVEHPEISTRLVIALGRRLRETNERLSRQSFQTVQSRVAVVLSELVAQERARRQRRRGRARHRHPGRPRAAGGLLARVRQPLPRGARARRRDLPGPGTPGGPRSARRSSSMSSRRSGSRQPRRRGQRQQARRHAGAARGVLRRRACVVRGERGRRDRAHPPRAPTARACSRCRRATSTPARRAAGGRARGARGDGARRRARARARRGPLLVPARRAHDPQVRHLLPVPLPRRRHRRSRRRGRGGPLDRPAARPRRRSPTRPSARWSQRALAHLEASKDR